MDILHHFLHVYTAGLTKVIFGTDNLMLPDCNSSLT